MKRIIYSILAILLAIEGIAFLFTPQRTDAAGEGWLSGWAYRKQITITGSVDGAKTNYQMYFNVNYAASADVSGNVTCNSLCQTDFDDIRFTTSDGSTEIDYWLENYGASSRGMFWVEVPYIPIAPNDTTIYMYYGNATAVTTSSGEDTFIVFDDFEDAVAGIWTTTAGTVDYASNTHSWGAFGTQSMLLDVVGATPAGTKCTVAYSQNIAVQYRTWKTNAGDWGGLHGNGDHTSYFGVSTTENLRYYDVGWNNLIAVSHSTWEKAEVRDFNWTANTYDIYFNDVLRGGNEPTYVSGVYDSVYQYAAAGGSDDTWIDNFLVRNWTTNAPTITAYSSTEYPISTEISSYHSTPRAIINGTVVSETITQYGFDYGTTSAMVNSITTLDALTAADRFSYILSNLSNGTVYYYRAKAYTGSAWIYGDQKRFAMSPQPWEYYDTNSDNYTKDIQSSTWEYQTFTVTERGHKISKVDVQLRGVGALGTGNVYVYIQEAGAGYPSGNTLAYGTMTASLISTTVDTWYSFALDTEIDAKYGSVYSIVLSYPTGTGAVYVRWRADTSAPTYVEGQSGYSTDGGGNWTAVPASDNMFRVWGDDAFEVKTGKAFRSYISDDDWLFTCSYLNEYSPYYPAYDVSQHFYIQLSDNTTVIAQNTLRQWEYAPASLYISKDDGAALEWGKSTYRIRIYNTDSPNPIMEYPLQPEDWVGTDLNQLDQWCIATAHDMEIYYGETLTINIADQGEVLNQKGGVLFANGIPELRNIRPGLFQTSTSGVTSPDVNSITYKPAWQTLVGPTVTTAFTNFASVAGVSPEAVGGIIVFLFMIAIAVGGFGTGHALAGTTISSVCIIPGVILGFYPPALLAVTAMICALVLIWQFWLKGG